MLSRCHTARFIGGTSWVGSPPPVKNDSSLMRNYLSEQCNFIIFFVIETCAPSNRYRDHIKGNKTKTLLKRQKRDPTNRPKKCFPHGGFASTFITAMTGSSSSSSRFRAASIQSISLLPPSIYNSPQLPIFFHIQNQNRFVLTVT